MKLIVIILSIGLSWPLFAKDFEKKPKAEFKEPWPTLILFHDVWGLDSYVEHEAQRFADQGFYVYAMDLYGGVKPTELRSAYREKEKVSIETVSQRTEKLISKLSKNKSVDRERIGLLGWGMGGGLALKMAINQNQAVRSFAMIYGRPTTDVADLKNLKARGLAIFADGDDQVPQRQIDLFKSGLKEAHSSVNIHVIPKAKARFMDFTRTDSFNPKAAEEAKSLLDDFLARHLSLTKYVK